MTVRKIARSRCIVNRVERTFIALCFVSAIGLGSAFGQAQINPNLPEAPVRESGAIFTPGYAVVRPEETSVPPLTAKQKFQVATHKTFSPSILVKSAIFTGFDRGLSTGPDYGEGWESVGKLYGYTTANIASTYMIGGGLVPVLFHQDPRYFRKGSGTVKSRILYALRSEMVAYSDRGTLMPNYGTIIGFGMSSALSNAYLPSDDVTFRNTMSRYALKFAVSSGFRVWAEFGGYRGLIDRLHHR
jgi:hypothetical protein